jgi:hypothetical protein
MGRAEITADADAALEKMQADKEKKHGKSKHDVPELTAAQKAAADEDPGLILTFLQWVLQREKKPPLPWTISRREEVDSYLVTRSFGPYALLTLALGESFWYNRIKHSKMAYMVCKCRCKRYPPLLLSSKEAFAKESLASFPISEPVPIHRANATPQRTTVRSAESASGQIRPRS